MKLNTLKAVWYHCALSTLLVLALTQVYTPKQATAQVLNLEVRRLLANDCNGLNPSFSLGIPQGFGPNLTALCTSGGGSSPNGASSTGGGAASVQASAASILNRTLLGRLEDLKNEEREGIGQPSSMRFSPLSLVSMVGMPNLNVSSPLYAATTAGGGSTASFVASSSSRWKGLGFFASGLVESLNRDITLFQDGYKSNILGITAGGDYRFTNKLIAGLAMSYSNTDGDFRSGGNFSSNSYAGLLFATYLPTDRTFIQVTGGYTRNKYLVSRFATADTRASDGGGALTQGLASGNSSGNVFNLGLLAGFDYALGRLTIGPRVGVNYSNTHIGDFTERGNTGVELRYSDQWINSLQSIVGVQGTVAFSSRLGVLVPQFNADYIHEFANSQRLIHAQFAQDFRGAEATQFTFQNDVPVRNYFNLGTGLVMVLPNGWQTFVNFRAMVGNEQFNNYAGSFGLRIAL